MAHNAMRIIRVQRHHEIDMDKKNNRLSNKNCYTVFANYLLATFVIPLFESATC